MRTYFSSWSPARNSTDLLGLASKLRPYAALHPWAMNIVHCHCCKRFTHGSQPYPRRTCLPAKRMLVAFLYNSVLLQVVAFVAASVCVHCKTESGDTSVKALVATLRKRLSAARNLLPPRVHNVQVQISALPHQVGKRQT